MTKFLLLSLILASTALADTPPPGAVKVKDAAGNLITSTLNTGKQSLDVNVSNSIAATVAGPVAVTGTFWQATQPVSGSLGRTWSLGFSTDKVDASGSSVSVTNFPSSITNYSLETGGHLASLDAKAPALGQALAAGSVPVVLPAAQISALTPLSSVSVSNFPATQNVAVTNTPSVSGSGNFTVVQPTASNLNATAVTTGGATIAKDSSLTTINTTLGSPFQAGGSIGNTSFGISGTLPAFASIPTVKIDQTTPGTTNGVQINAAIPAGTNSIGTVVQTALATGSISNNAAITTTASTFTAPANAIGFILEAESGNTDNIRWAIGSTATSSVGMLAEPGRDSGYIPLAANISVIAISGTQSASVQWVVR